MKKPNEISEKNFDELTKTFLVTSDSFSALMQRWIDYRNKWIKPGVVIRGFISTGTLDLESFSELAEALLGMDSLLKALERFDFYSSDLLEKMENIRAERAKELHKTFRKYLLLQLIKHLRDDRKNIQSEINLISIYTQRTYGEASNKSSKRVEKLTLFIIGLTIATVFTASVSLYFSYATLNEATRPPSLIVELSSEKGSFDDSQQAYMLGGPPDNRADKIRINIWNTGDRVAENVVVSVRFSPQNSSLYDINSLEVCRELVCTMKGSPTTIKAIEPNGFYTIIASVEVNAANLKVSGTALFLTIDITNPKGSERLIYHYSVQT